MKLTTIAISLFIILEFLNVIILYFAPTSKKGNGVGVFNALEKSKEIPEVYRLIKYLINWVAGTKLIFIGLLIVILITGDKTTQTLSVIVLILTILSFYWRLYPLLKEMDNNEELNPKGYSKHLGKLILVFVLIFAIALVVTLINN